MSMIVLKFGGSSLATADKVRRCMAIVGREAGRDPVVVVSAHGRMTDCLIRAAQAALGGKVDTEEFEQYHMGLAADLGVDRRLIENLMHRLESLLHGVSLIGELTARTMDHVMSFGERVASCMVAAALTNEGLGATPVSAWDLGLITDSIHGHAAPLPGIEAEIARRLAGIPDIAVVTGFIARDAKGNITTLGRSGSDYTAAIIGAAAGAEEIQIWTDVDGVMTADPALCPAARNIPVMSFHEAGELAHYGAEVLHPSTLLPAVARGIPVLVANAMRPHAPGTRILSGSAPVPGIAKSVVYKEDLCLLSCLSHRFRSTAELLTAALGTLSALDIDIHIAATSESSVSFVTYRPYDEETLGRAAGGLEKLGEVTMEREKALVCVVGEELRGNPEVLGKIFTAMGRAGINARMVSQSASEINVAFLVENAQIERAVTALHDLLTG